MSTNVLGSWGHYNLHKQCNDIVRAYWRLFNRLYPDNIPENDMDGAYYYPDTTALESYCEDTVARAYDVPPSQLAVMLDQAAHYQTCCFHQRSLMYTGA